MGYMVVLFVFAVAVDALAELLYAECAEQIEEEEADKEEK